MSVMSAHARANCSCSSTLHLTKDKSLPYTDGIVLIASRWGLAGFVILAQAGIHAQLNHDRHDVEMIAMMHHPYPLDSGFRRNDVGCAKGEIPRCARNDRKMREGKYASFPRRRESTRS